MWSPFCPNLGFKRAQAKPSPGAGANQWGCDLDFFDSVLKSAWPGGSHLSFQRRKGFSKPTSGELITRFMEANLAKGHRQILLAVSLQSEVVFFTALFFTKLQTLACVPER